jgi:RHS repeat-associated protein
MGIEGWFLALSKQYIRLQQTYDSMGRSFQVSNPYRPCNSETKENTTTLYDALNRPLSITTADSSPTTMSYLDNQTSIADPAGITRSTVTDAAGRTVSVTEAGALLTSHLYDALNDLTKVCQGAAFVNKICQSGQPRTFVYDSLARLTSATNPESGTTTYTYDNNGNLLTKTDANTNITTLSYDALNRVTSKAYTFTSGYTTPNVTYCYDGNTQPPCTNAPSGSNANLVGHTTLVSATLSGVPISSTSYGQYDTLGDILQSTQITGRDYPFTYTYNLANTMLGMTLPSGRTLTWTYDSANRIASAGGTPPGGTGKTYASSITYASQGPIKQFNLGNGLVEVRSYDAYRQQLTGVSLGPNGSILNLGFDYCTGTPPQTSCTNNNGNLQSQTISPLGVTQNYTYDSYNRLYTSGEKAGTTTTWSENFNYDSFGNRWVLPNPVGITLSPWTVTTNYYNSATNRLTYNDFGYDNGGNQTTISPYTVSYDVENRQSGFTSTSNGSATYTYDGDGRRVEKTAGGVTTTYVYDATGNLAAEYSSQPPSMPCQTCYLTTDHLGSTRVITSQTGGLVSRHDFLPFGEELATSNRTAAQGYGVADNVMQRYTGQQRDLEGPVLDFFGARYFQGAQGRFTSPDWSATPQPVPYADLADPQTLNLYSYVRNNPLAKRDLDGHVCAGDDCGDVKVTVTSDSEPHVIVNQQIGDQYKSGVGTTLTIKFSDSTGPLSGMAVKESNSVGSGKLVENPNPVTTKSQGQIKDVVMKAVASESDPKSSPSAGEVQEHVNSIPLTTSTTQVLTFTTPGANGQTGSTCQATYTRTLSNTDSKGNLNTQNNSQGVNYTLTTTAPVVKTKDQ